MIDLSTVKLGDEVTVRGKVVSTHRPSTNGCLYVEISENCQGYVERSAIVSHAPKALAVGDRVKRSDAEKPYAAEIIAIDRTGEWAVLQRTDKNEQPWICALSLLEAAQ